LKPPAILLEQADLADLDAALSREWFLPNGLGGYAASTVVGANTRGHHGLLVVRVAGAAHAVMLAKLEETVRVGDREYPLSTNIYGDTTHPAGHANQIGFELGSDSVTFTYRAGPCTVRKTVFCRHGANATCVIYEADRPAALDVRAMLACRRLGERAAADQSLHGAIVGETRGVLVLRPRRDLPVLHLAHNAAALDEDTFWYERLTYPAEAARGQPDREDLLSPCGLRFEIGPGRPAHLVASTDPLDALPDVAAWLNQERARVAALAAPIEEVEDGLGQLVLAADAFLVRPAGTSGGGVEIVAGYPGCGDRWRETFIALPGLTLVPGAFDAARDVLRGYLPVVREGLSPGASAENGASRSLGAIDVGLWYIHAVGEFWRYTQDAETVREVLLPACRQIAKGYVGGTWASCRAGADGLLHTTASEVPLTWMDAIVDGRPVTPRTGKPVEVQALWYNALRTLDWLESTLNGKRLTQYAGMADIARASFLSQFWNYRTSSLHDVVETGGHDIRLRPNQILAVSLPFTMLNRQQMRGVVNACQRHLMAPMGLRTLAPTDADYVGSPAGTAAGRDGLSHQGVVWSWLMGPFVSASVRAYGHTAETVRVCRERMSALLDHVVTGGCLGQVSECFDGDPPHAAHGRFASAVSVAELLRAIWEDLLGRRGRPIRPPPAPPRTQRSSRRARRR